MSDAFSYFADPSTEETQKFVLMFDKFFDCMNVRSLKEWAFKRKDNLKPYCSPTDDRLQVLCSVHVSDNTSKPFICDSG